MKRADARVESSDRARANEEPRKEDDDVILVDEIPPHCGHILVDDEGREVDYWPRFRLREEQ